MNPSIIEREISKYNNGNFEIKNDFLSIEEPLEISIVHKNLLHKISITMRTPGFDKELALGFLFTENIISKYSEIDKIEQINLNQIHIFIKESIILELEKLKRNFYTTSSCGVCGKSSLESLRTINPQLKTDEEVKNISPDIIISLKTKIQSIQSNFSLTGGIHASFLYDFSGNYKYVYEDVGRHNALDKLIGHYFIQNHTNLNEYILLLSGRASFELIQKAAMANIKVICALGAPSSLAVETAKEFKIRLIGFLKDYSYNIYC